jgi:hypothetical protein
MHGGTLSGVDSCAAFVKCTSSTYDPHEASEDLVPACRGSDPHNPASSCDWLSHLWYSDTCSHCASALCPG